MGLKSEIKATIKAAGLTVEEFAVLCGVTRVTVYNWMKGAKIDPLRVPRIEKIIDSLESAVNAKDAPINRPHTRKVDKEAVLKIIKGVVIKHLKIITEAG